jgi:hypothetical protein
MRMRGMRFNRDSATVTVGRKRDLFEQMFEPESHDVRQQRGTNETFSNTFVQVSGGMGMVQKNYFRQSLPSPM